MLLYFVEEEFMANKISEYRAKVNLSQAKLAKACGWNNAARIANYELGNRSPSIDDAKVIIKTFNKLGVSCTFEDVFTRDEKVI